MKSRELWNTAADIGALRKWELPRSGLLRVDRCRGDFCVRSGDKEVQTLIRPWLEVTTDRFSRSVVSIKVLPDPPTNTIALYQTKKFGRGSE